jgi:peptidyl-prolyl cis-trans isomerase A (cyclophilin A)
MSHDHDKEASPRRRGRFRFQFGLSTLLLLILLIAVPLTWQRERITKWVDSLWSTPPAADLFPRVVLHTTLGDITVRLNTEKAPLTVENFLKYVDDGFYTDVIFHEVRRGDVILGGGYTRDLKEKPTPYPPVRNEAHNGMKNVRGTISMVRQPNVIDSSISQFFFNLADNTDYLDPQPLQRGERPEQVPVKYGYCVFGEVVEGMDVLDQIAALDVSDYGGVFNMLPKRLVVIQSAERVKARSSQANPP